jgi:Effector-associated domain 2
MGLASNGLDRAQLWQDHSPTGYHCAILRSKGGYRVLTAALVAWVVAVVGDRALARLRFVALGKPDREALGRAMDVACTALLARVPGDLRPALSDVLSETFSKPPLVGLDGNLTVKAALLAAALAQIEPVRFADFGLDDDEMRAAVADVVIRSIQQVGSSSVALHPLASQLSLDTVQESVDHVLDVVQAVIQHRHDGSVVRRPAGRLDILGPFIDAVLAVPVMGNYTSRMTIISSLPPVIRDNISRDAMARIDVLNTIHTCQNYAGGLRELLAAIRMIEGDSLAVRNLDAVVKQLPGDDLMRPYFAGDDRR